VSPELRLRMEENPRQHRFTLVLTRGEDAKVILSGDKATCAAAPVVREAYSPELFAEMRTRRIAVLTYHKYPGTDWLEEEFREQQVQLSGGETVGMKLAERGTMLSNRLWVREVRKLSEGGRQTAILSTNYEADYAELAVSLFARWSQENFFKYMREHYGLDRLVEHGTETIPDSVRVVNPAWRKLDGQIRTLSGRRQRLLAQFAALGLEGDLSVSDVAATSGRRRSYRRTSSIPPNNRRSGNRSVRAHRITSPSQNCRKPTASPACCPSGNTFSIRSS